MRVLLNVEMIGRAVPVETDLEMLEPADRAIRKEMGEHLLAAATQLLLAAFLGVIMDVGKEIQGQ